MLKAVLAAGALCVVAACGSSTGASPAKTASPTPTPSVTVDAAATQMCQKLAQGRTLEANANYAQVNEVRAMTMRIQAQTLALKTAVPEIQKIASDASDAGEMIPVPKLEAWCTSHGFTL
jgi:hypothetical protein